MYQKVCDRWNCGDVVERQQGAATARRNPEWYQRKQRGRDSGSAAPSREGEVEFRIPEAHEVWDSQGTWTDQFLGHTRFRIPEAHEVQDSWGTQCSGFPGHMKFGIPGAHEVQDSWSTQSLGFLGHMSRW